MALVHKCLRALGLRVVDDGWQRLVVDVDQLGRVFGEVEALGDHQRDRITDEAHLVFGQRWAGRLGTVRPDRSVPLLLDVRVEVGSGEHPAHPGQRERRGHLDAPDGGAGEGTAHKGRVQHSGKRDVVDEGAMPGEQSDVLDPVDTRVPT